MEAVLEDKPWRTIAKEMVESSVDVKLSINRSNRTCFTSLLFKTAKQKLFFWLRIGLFNVLLPSQKKNLILP